MGVARKIDLERGDTRDARRTEIRGRRLRLGMCSWGEGSYLDTLRNQKTRLVAGNVV